MDDMVEQLASLGMTGDEARAYVALNRLGPTGAADLARVLRVSRPQSYRLVESLAEQGFVTTGVGRPRLFSPVPPAIVLKAFELRCHRTLEDIERARRDLVPQLDAMGKGARQVEGPTFSLLRNLDTYVSQSHQLMASARDRLDILLTEGGGKELLRSLEPNAPLVRKAAEGLAIRIAAQSPAQALRRLPAVLRRPNVVVRQFRGDAVSTCIIADRREAVVVVAAPATRGDKEEDLLAIRTTAPHFVTSNQLLFDRMWAAAQNGASNESEKAE